MNTTFRSTPAWLLSTAALAFSANALAQNPAGVAAVLQPAEPRNVLTLTASATTDVAMDWLTVVFNTTREGADAAQVQAQLRQALDTALTEARKAARPGEVQVRTGNFSLNPRYVNKNGTASISGWVGSAELIVEGRDSQAISQLTGRVHSLNIGRVAWSLSREARERVEGDVTAEAIARFRAKAEAVSKHFGLSGYGVREVNVQTNEPQAAYPVQMMRSAAMAAPQAEGLPVEAGKAQVSATVSGSVQMK